ncbi:MAG TPA: DUF3168 domain-containing protein [Hellea balneolensis]|uniref:DUF3168 domain-containing protein n=1 Tax=Hellea balneolensis TaxID=287478 RepID=A0A7C3GKK7_9PROT|nr:DUF3168 domain-containing protein [Hellea balneolensis]
MNDMYQSQALAKAVHTVLHDDIMVQSLLGNQPRLYDHPPEDPVYPYLSYGPMRSDNISADDCAAYRHVFTLHVWSRYGGRAEIMSLISAISQALEGGGLTLNTAHLVSMNVIFSDHFRAPDGRTLHGLIRVSAVTQPLTETV